MRTREKVGSNSMALSILNTLFQNTTKRHARPPNPIWFPTELHYSREDVIIK